MTCLNDTFVNDSWSGGDRKLRIQRENLCRQEKGINSRAEAIVLAINPVKFHRASEGICARRQQEKNITRVIIDIE